MGGLKEFRIYFDNPLATYYGGQVVSGYLSVKLDKEKTMRGIEVRFRGRAEVEWKESRTVRDSNGKSRTVWETYSACESYFENRKYLVGSEQGDMALPVGNHAFPFILTLPNNLPSSFEGQYGNVRYTVKATMKRPWKFDHDAKAAFTVLSQLDLNSERNIQEPYKAVKEKFLCCCCCKSGPITLIATVPVTGFVPGQDIPIFLEVDNTNTDVVISNIICKLKKTVWFSARHLGHDKVRKTEDKVASVETNEMVGLTGCGNWTLKLKVPSVPASYLKHCNIIDIKYELGIKGVIDGPHANMKTEIPIIIGTIPLVSFFPNMVPASAPPMVPRDSDLPPSFNEVVGGGEPALGWNVNPTPKSSPYPSKKDVVPGPYPPGGSAPYPPPPGGSSPYPPPPGGSAPYPAPPGESSPYPPRPGGSSPYPTKRGPSDPYAPPTVLSLNPPPGVHGPQPPTAGLSRTSAPYAPSAPFDPNPPYPDMPPPSYEECVFGRKDIKENDDSDHTHGEMGFAPRYPMYQFNQ
ncbi:arrestin domain-containing protein 2 [Anabrus simplex]|uniref:arrestin domain-containing protein 2 n=1 Tax=Anabrus simplex TaxID=316456 RepID=UPI0035A34492